MSQPSLSKSTPQDSCGRSTESVTIQPDNAVIGQVTAHRSKTIKTEAADIARQLQTRRGDEDQLFNKLLEVNRLLAAVVAVHHGGECRIDWTVINQAPSDLDTLIGFDRDQYVIRSV